MTIGWQADGNGSGTAHKSTVCLLTGALLLSALMAADLPWASAARVTSAAGMDVFRGVAATSPANAWIVGYSSASDTSRAHTLIAHWNGRIWQRVPSPNAAGLRTSSFLEAVAATSRRSAWAVGESNLGRTNWKLVASPSSDTAVESLSAISAVSADDAWAVGTYDSQTSSKSPPLILHWNGARWAVVTVSFR